MYPIQILGKSYTASDFTSPGYESKIKEFVQDCAAYLAGAQYPTAYSGHHSAYFSGSYDPAIGSANFNGAVGGNRIVAGMQVVVASLTTEKIAYGVVTAANVVSSVSGVVTKNYTVQVSVRYNPSPGSPSSGWVILPGPLPVVDSTSILPVDMGGSGTNTASGLAVELGTTLPDFSKASYVEDFEGIHQSTNASSYSSSQADGVLPPNVYAPCGGSGIVNFSCPDRYFSFLDGNTVGVANLEVREPGDCSCILASDDLVSYPMRNSSFTCRFIIIPETEDSSNRYTFSAGLLDFGTVTPNIPNITLNSVYPTGLVLNRNDSGEVRVRREFNSSSTNWVVSEGLKSRVWYTLKVLNEENNLRIAIVDESTGTELTPSSLGTTTFTNATNMCTPFVKLYKTAGNSFVNVLVDYFHWRLPGERFGLPD